MKYTYINLTQRISEILTIFLKCAPLLGHPLIFGQSFWEILLPGAQDVEELCAQILIVGVDMFHRDELKLH